MGLGYVGLPLAVEFAEVGFPVTGFDLDPKKIETLNAGESYIEDVPSEQVERNVSGGRLSACSSWRSSVIRRSGPRAGSWSPRRTSRGNSTGIRAARSRPPCDE